MNDNNETEYEASYLESTRHVFRAGDETALCGTRSTADHDREAITFAVNETRCKRCQASLLSENSDYRSPDALWRELDSFEQDDRVVVEFANGESVDVVVTRPSEDERDNTLSGRSVGVTTDPETLRYKRDWDDDFRVRKSEGQPAKSRQSISDDGPFEDREVVGVHRIGVWDRFGSDDADREAFVAELEARRADLNPERFDQDGTEQMCHAYLEELNAGAALEDAIHRVKGDLGDEAWPLAWIEQKATSKVDAFGGGSGEDAEDDAKRRGKVAGYQAVLDALDAARSDHRDAEGDEYRGNYRSQRMENAHYWAAQMLGWMKDGPNAGLRGTYYVDILGGKPVLVMDGDEWDEWGVKAIKDGLRDYGVPEPMNVKQDNHGDYRLFVSEPSSDRQVWDHHPNWREFEPTGGDGGDRVGMFAADQLEWDTPNPAVELDAE